MQRIIVLGLAIHLGLATSTQAAPTIVVGSNPNIPVSAAATIDIFVTGLGTSPNSIGAVDLYVGIADQSLGAAPAGEPSINSVDVVTGTIFSGNSESAAPGQVLFGSANGSSQVVNIDDITGSGVLTANGELFSISLDTLGVANSTTWSLDVFGVVGNNSVFSNDQSLAVPFLGSNGTFTIVPALPGDANFDGIVNGQDIGVIASHWLQSEQPGQNGDVNEDGIVNGQDVAALASHWLQTTSGGAGGSAAVPEPATLVIAALGGLALVARRRPQ